MSIRLVAVLLCLLMTPSVLADGKIMSRVSPDVAIPDQQAIIHYADGIETLVIETSFIGEGDEFAWIVPLPSVPEVEEASEGIFEVLRETALTVVHSDVNLGPTFLILAIGVLAWLHRQSSPEQKPNMLAAIFPFLFGCTCLVGIFLPTLGAPRGVQSASTPEGVTVHQQGRVGAMDVAVLSSDAGGTLMAWLETNGYKTPDGIERVVSDYVKEDWCFVAAKLSRDASVESAVTRPLRFRFYTHSPVYPMRLTGVTDQGLNAVLWVASDRRANAKNFEIAQCKRFETKVSYRASGMRSHMSPQETLTIENPGLSATIGGGGVLTKLSAKLRPQQMRGDVYIRFEPFAFHEEEYRTLGNWFAWVLNCLMVVIALVALATNTLIWERDALGQARRRIIRGAVGVTLVCFIVILIASEPARVIATETYHPMKRSVKAMSVHRELVYALLACDDQNTVTPEAAQRIVDRIIAELPDDERGAVAGIRHASAPLCYTLHRRAGEPISGNYPLILVTYNEAGGIADVFRFPTTARESKDGTPPTAREKFDGTYRTADELPLRLILSSDEWQFRDTTHDPNADE